MAASLANRLREWTAGNRLLVLVAVVAAFLAYRLGEKIAVNDGYGWDGVVYGGLAEGFRPWVRAHGLDGNQARRVLPPAAVNAGLRLLGVPRTKPNVVCAFGLLNVGMIAAAAWAWGRIADRERLGRGGKWLGFVGLFVNFAVLKWIFYDPVLTDACAFALGLLLLESYLADNRRAVVGLTAAGAFVWPTFIYHGLPLIVFPRGAAGGGDRGGAPMRLNWYLAGAVTLLVCAAVVQLLRGKIGYESQVVAQTSGQLCLQPFGVNACVSLVALAAYLWLGLTSLVDDRPLFRPRAWLASTGWLPVAAAVAVFLDTRRLAAALATAPAVWSMHDVLVFIGWESVRKPWLFVLAHVVFFGPVVLLALLRWPRVCRGLHGYGPGVVLCTAGGMLLGLDAESRHSFHCFPVLVLGVVKGMEGVRWRLPHYGLFAALALALSKVWLPIGAAPDAAFATEFPAQRLFMNLGTRMSWPMYFAQGGCALLAGGVVFLLISRGRVRVATSDGIRPTGVESCEPNRAGRPIAA